ncbi:hypothetical protein [Wolbachia endosymbiont (group B) of Horisme vitalbata]|uniref:hypothetical protein n=1 Tax=Wolbachia endosymbiont (group B) of Horisme vitalbata TaxID=3066178 RepID=UPI00333F114F
MPNTLPSKVGESSKTVKKTQSSSKRTSSESSKDSDRYETSVVTSTGRKNWYELLQEKIGFDVTAKEWMTNHPELVNENKSEVLIRLACEVCLAKNTEYDPENENEEQKNKYIRFDTQRIFEIFKVASPMIEQSDRKSFVKFVCQKGNVKLLEMICKKEKKDKVSFGLNKQYSWKGNFSGYSRLIELLQYVIDNRCSPEIVLCLAEKTYGYAHILYNGEQYFSKRKIADLKKKFNYQDSDIKDLLKQAVKLGYKDAVSVMLSGDIYHCIRSMKLETFQEKEEFVQAYDIIKK